MGGLAFLALVLPGEAFAATKSVCASSCDYTTFAAAAAGIVDGDIIEFRDSGTYAGADVTKSCTIQVQGSLTPTINTRLHVVNKTVTISGVRLAGSTNHCVDVDPGSIVTVRNLTMESCSGANGGGIYAAAGATATTISVDNVTFQNNTSTGNGGHIGVTGKVNLTVANSTFLADTTSGKGGAIAFDRGAEAPTTGLVVTNSVFTGTTAVSHGGAIFTNVTTSITGSWFTDSRTTTVAGYGGALYSEGTQGVTAYRNVFCKNGSAAHVGGMWLSNTSTDVIMNNVFVGNYSASGYNGAGLATVGSPNGATIAFNHFLSNSAPTTLGGAAYLAHSTDSFHDNLVAYNTAAQGGGVYGLNPITTSYDLYYGNTSDVGSKAVLGATDISGKDPVLNGYDSKNVLCGKGDLDELFPEYSYPSKSPLIDAGDPAFKDPDGTRADIGAFGGPQADPALWADADNDTFRALFDCNDKDAASFPAALYTDGDGDGYGGASAGITDCARTGLVAKSGDCDDAKSTVNPGVVESCNKIDDDCDKAVDETGATGSVAWYADADADTYGNPVVSKLECAQPTGYVINSMDCDDTKSAVNPAASELCSTVGVDDNCNNSKDENTAKDVITWYLDSDVDKYGGTTSTKQCTQPVGYITTPGDCNDSSALINPGVNELCSTAGVDDNCNGTKDEATASDVPTWYVDADADTYGTATTTKQCLQPAGYANRGGDCNDGNAAISPGDPEVCNGVDDDCDTLLDDGLVFKDYYKDADVDGYGVDSTKKSSCVTIAGYVNVGGDCNDGNAAVSPGDVEVCNGADDDCDTLLDDGLVFKDYYVDADVDGYGVDSTKKNSCLPVAGSVTTPGDCNDGNPAVSPGDAEVCGNGVDDNCDGVGGPTGDDDGDKLTYTQELAAKSSDCKVDSDGDSLGDALEHGSGTKAIDSDADGLADLVDVDDDNDGVTTLLELGEGADPLAVDSDNDLILDGDEWGGGAVPLDSDQDATPDVLDDDDDGDGILSVEEGNDDFECANKSCKLTCDGVPNYLDLDSDGDGATDSAEMVGDLDLDDDGVDNYLDCNDSDGGLGDNDSDGLTNAQEKSLGTDPTEVDSDSDGIDDLAEVEAVGDPRDTDEDGVIDALDEDDDGDGFLSVDEIGSPASPNDTDEDGAADYVDADDDGDGVPSEIELDGDQDLDGIANYLDGDDEDGPLGDEDADGLSNQQELDAGTDPLKTDSDEDGVPDEIELGDPAAEPPDSDGDKTIDALDSDDDGDGLSTRDEEDYDLDGDGDPNYLDTDSDGDGIPDQDESGEDPDCDGVSGLLDADDTDGPCLQDDRTQPDVVGLSDTPPACGSAAGATSALLGLLAAAFIRRRNRRFPISL